jgi:hypothetical protein
MLEKCGPVKPEITLADNIFLMNRIVEKQMHSRQKIEIKQLMFSLFYYFLFQNV